MPDIPRLAWKPVEEPIGQQVFGALQNTSGSMDRYLLVDVLSTVASCSEAREVHHIRLVFCDAAACDQSIIRFDDMAEAVQVK